MLRLTFLMICLASPVLAEPPPPVPEDGLTHYKSENCTDPVWGLQGTCFYSFDRRNNHYIAFYIKDNLCMFIMQRIDGEYKEIWRRSADT